ncbi:MAG: restriction endonuclease subunit S, partial [Synergistaceae bacterium]|nr:restriction endonuclease subunit S [Synergistaceae bacterium]
DDILTRTEGKITQKALDETALKLQKPGAVIIAMYGATIGKLAILGIPATTNQACCVCEVFEGTYNKFLFYSLMYYREQMKTLSAGAAQPNISKQIITQYSIPLPTLQEQTAIADTLTALDTEISSLEAERLKISQIRDGAMNDLLTGKVRLTHGN